MTLIEQAAYYEGFRDGVETREQAVAQEFEEKRDLELYVRTLEARCKSLERTLWSATALAAASMLLNLFLAAVR